MVTVGLDVFDGGIEVNVFVGIVVGTGGSQALGCPAFTSCCTPSTDMIVVLAPETVTVLKNTSLLAIAVPEPD